MIKSVRAEILALKSLAMAPATLTNTTLPYAFKSKLNQHGPFSVP